MEKQQIRILDYLHQSNHTLKSDSNFFVHKSVFKYLQKHYPDQFYFYTTYDSTEENDAVMKKIAKEFGNINPVPIKYFSTNAFFRNALDWDSFCKNTYDYDLIWNNTPEIGFELLSYSIAKGTYCPMINYSHWLPSLVNKPIRANYLKGQREQLVMEAKYFYNYILAHKNYNNSAWGTKLLKKEFENISGAPWHEEVIESIKPLYLSVDHEEIDMFKPKELKKFEVPVLVFNHRANVYTGYTEFFRAVEKIIKLRPNLKFKIYLTCVGEVDRSSKFDIADEYFLYKESLPFPKYIETLWRSHIQIGAHTGDNQWSMSFLDGMFSGLIPIYKKGHFFDEMFAGLSDINEYGFNDYEDDLVGKLIYMIENIDYFQKKNQVIFDHFRNHWTWDNLIPAWADAFIDAYNQTRRYKDSNKMSSLNIEEIIFPKTWSEMKKILNISDQRPCNQYRAILKENFGLKEDMKNKEVVLYKKDQPITRQGGFF